MKISAVITAAGLSTRMGDFKPLLELNGFPIIYMAAASLLDAGAVSPVAVLGNRADKTSEALQSLKVQTVINPAPEMSDMFDSVCLGIKELPECDAFFVLPCDMPLISAKTMRKLAVSLAASDMDYICPLFGDKSGHPPLISSRCIDAILSHSGSDGLKGALSAFCGQKLQVYDHAVILDADTQIHFSELTKYAKKTHGLSREKCEEIYEELCVPENIRAHCRAVAKRCREMCTLLNAQGYGLNTELCVSAGLLHDIFKTSENHYDCVRKYLSESGYLALAEITGSHKHFAKNASLYDEESILTLADRTIKETNLVTPEVRYASMLSRHAPGSLIGDNIRRDLAKCIELYDAYAEVTLSED